MFFSSSKKFLKVLAGALMLSQATLALAQDQNQAMKKPMTAILVHGAFADGSSWNGVIPFLQEKGLNVIAVQNPLTSLADDVTAVKHALDLASGPVILVGHSWGGAVITEAGADERVKALVYVAAAAPSDGQSAFEEGNNLAPSPGLQSLAPDASGFVRLTPESLAENFAPDMTEETAKVMAATQGPIAMSAFNEKITTAGWKGKSNFYIITANDRMVQPELQTMLAKKLKAKTTILQSSHVPMLSQPSQVAKVILDAADSIQPQQRPR